MDAIQIPRLLKLPQQTEVIDFNESIAGLETLTPVRGKLKVTHQGTYLEVSAQAEAIVTLTCDRCLQQYNHRLAIAPSEMIWLNADSEFDADALMERDLTTEDLIEALPPDGEFNPTTWIYEQLCLELPQQQLCDRACPGIPLTPTVEPVVDQRWAALNMLKNQLADSN
jgi:uncharacterized protein